MGREREVEMKMLQSLAAGPVKNENRTRIKWHKSAKRKGKKKKNQFIRCELCHRDRDFNTNTLPYTVSQCLSTSHWVCVSG